MKKETKEKLNKLKKPLMIISLLINIIFILMIVFGSIINGKDNKAQSVKADDSVASLVGTTWSFNNVLSSQSPQNKDMLNNTDYNLYSEEYNLKFTSNNLLFSQLRFQRFPILLINSYLAYDGTQVYTYQNQGSVQNTWDNSSFKTITIYEGEDTNNSLLISWFYQNATLVSASDESVVNDFIFSKNFNYNAPYNTSGDSVFVTGTAGQKTFNFSNYFISNGETFNCIRLTYISGNGTNYFESPNSTLVRTNNNTNFIQYGYMEFGNTSTNVFKVVNNRNFRSYYNISSESTNMAMDFGSTWTNSNYQTLRFYGVLTSIEETYLNQFNNYDVYSSFTPGQSTDVGLGNVFTLIGSAFGAFSSIFAIQLLPGITIGLLFFMPLIVGIILLIIWLIKR